MISEQPKGILLRIDGRQEFLGVDYLDSLVKTGRASRDQAGVYREIDFGGEKQNYIGQIGTGD